MKNVVLVIRDTSTGEKSTLRFKNWVEAGEHVRMVIMGQIVEELYEIALNAADIKEDEDRDELRATVDELKDIADLVNHPRNEAALRDGIERWEFFVEDSTMHTVIKVV